MSHFFRLGSAHTPASRWYLGSPSTANGEEVDPRRFAAGTLVDVPGRLFLPMRRVGSPLDFTLADFDMPVVSERLANLFIRHAAADVQLIPVSVQEQSRPYFILNVRSVVKCINDAQSEIMWWTELDGRPEKVGRYRMIAKARLMTGEHAGEAIFRARDWKIMLLCTAGLRGTLESAKVTGVAFEPMEMSA